MIIKHVHNPSKRCSCTIQHESNYNEVEYIDYCPVHEAAPELLEALKAVMEAIAPNIERTVELEGESVLVSYCRKARHAIAKAEGRE